MHRVDKRFFSPSLRYNIAYYTIDRSIDHRIAKSNKKPCTNSDGNDKDHATRTLYYFCYKQTSIHYKVNVNVNESYKNLCCWHWLSKSQYKALLCVGILIHPTLTIKNGDEIIIIFGNVVVTATTKEAAATSPSSSYTVINLLL